MDVSEQIIQNHLIYGASDNTAHAGLSSSRTLNYANGPTITRPDSISISSIPYALKYQDSVGLFGAENYFVKISVSVNLNFVNQTFEEQNWESAIINPSSELDTNYSQAVIDINNDLSQINTFDPAFLNQSASPLNNAYISIDLNNLKTENIYVDNWLDVRLYTAEREEHPYDKMYIKPLSYFYLGIHARNTRRLPYNIQCIVGNEYISRETMSEEQKKYISRTIG